MHIIFDCIWCIIDYHLLGCYGIPDCIRIYQFIVILYFIYCVLYQIIAFYMTLYHGLAWIGILWHMMRYSNLNICLNMTLVYMGYYIDYIAYYIILIWHFIGYYLLRYYDISCGVATWQFIRKLDGTMWHMIWDYMAWNTILLLVWDVIG